MKTILTTLGGFIGMTSVAATFMQVVTKDGEVVRYDVENVAEVNYVIGGSKYEYVDLGLPSGTLWATYNIGATKPEEIGNYFAWGETESRETYSESNYEWYSEVSGYMKYNSYKDTLKTLQPKDDVATVRWGADWRMPTQEEIVELTENCQMKIMEINGVRCGKFIGPNGETLILPAAGGIYRSENITGLDGVYWSSSLYEKSETLAYTLFFSAKDMKRNTYYRYAAFPVRAVRAKK